MGKKLVHNKKNPILIILGFVFTISGALVWSSVRIYNVTPFIAQENIEVPVFTRPALERGIGEPVRIKIPSIAVDAAIEKVALTTDGSMDVPKNPFETGWYELGPRPGETGSAAIAGHVDWVNGATAVFADLYKVKPGDTIGVQDDKGTDISFVVREIRIFGATADATDVFISNDGRSRLNLITCSGAWNKSIQQYSERLVVFAEKVME
ncbi:MAG: class F sortase [bacterium]|nr:class F sortase [bacterium]